MADVIKDKRIGVISMVVRHQDRMTSLDEIGDPLRALCFDMLNIEFMAQHENFTERGQERLEKRRILQGSKLVGSLRSKDIHNTW